MFMLYSYCYLSLVSFIFFFLGIGKKGIAFKNCPTLNNPCLRNCVFIFKVTSLLSDYFFLLTVKQIAYLPYFHNESSQAQDTVADLQPVSS